MKKTYEIPELKIALLNKVDVIVTSDGGNGQEGDETIITP